jgi:hypothetical protein
VWHWNGRDWAAAGTMNNARSDHTMVFAPALGGLVVAGGFGVQPILVESGASWSAVAVLTRDRVSMALDPTRGSPLVFSELADRNDAPFELGTAHLGRAGTAAIGGGGCTTTTLGLMADRPYLGAPMTLTVWMRPPVQVPRPHAPLAWLLGAPADLPIGPCRLGVDPVRSVVWPDATNADAFASTTLSVPALPALRGVQLAAQAAIADPASPIGITLSLAQTLVVGG